MLAVLRPSFASNIVSELRERESLPSLEPEWSALWKRAPQSTPFELPAWVLAWLQHFGKNCDLRVLTLRADGMLTAVLPLLRAPEATTFSIAGAGISDYLGGCFDRDNLDAPSLFFQHVALEWPPGITLDLQELHSESPLLSAPAPESFNSTEEIRDCCPILSLPTSADRLQEKLAPGFRRNLEYATRRARRDFTIDFSTADANSSDELIDCFFDLHTKRWNARAGAGAFDNSEVREFHRSVATHFAQAGILRLHLLRLNEKPVSAFYGFKRDQTTFFYLGGFDPEFEKYSVGSLILDFSIRQAIAEQCSIFNFLRGREAYKYKWGAQDTLTYRRILKPGSRSGLISP